LIEQDDERDPSLDISRPIVKLAGQGCFDERAETLRYFTVELLAAHKPAARLDHEALRVLGGMPKPKLEYVYRCDVFGFVVGQRFLLVVLRPIITEQTAKGAKFNDALG
jgi:hypothetical protein